jgi:hypothetical protein
MNSRNALFAAASLCLSTLAACSADAVDAEGSSPTVGEEAELRSASSTESYTGSIDAGGSTFAVRLDVAYVFPSSVTQYIDCWAHKTNAGTCQLFFEGLKNTITTKLTISAPSGAVLATRESTSDDPPGVGYRSNEESARYLLNRGAAPTLRAEGSVSVEGVAAQFPSGGFVQLARGYGSPGQIDVPAATTFEVRRGSMADNTSGETRLSRHAFEGRASLALPEEIRVTAAISVEKQDFFGRPVEVVLRRAR